MPSIDRIKNLKAEILPVLTELQRGYENNELIGNYLFPPVEVPKIEGRVPMWGKDAFKLYDTERAIGEDSNQMLPGQMDWIDFRTQEHDLEYPVDYLEDEESMFDEMVNASTMSTEGVRLKIEKTQSEIAQNLSNYSATNKVTLDADNKWTNPQSNPQAHVNAGSKAIRKKTGKRPNLMILGAEAYEAAIVHPVLIEIVKYAQVGILDLELLKKIFKIPNIVVGESLYVTEAGEVFTDIWSDNCILAYVPTPGPAGQNARRPGYGYTLRKKGNPFVYKWQKNPKVTMINYTDNYKVLTTMPDAAYIINDTNEDEE